jgi:hypothetical protein
MLAATAASTQPPYGPVAYHVVTLGPADVFAPTRVTQPQDTLRLSTQPPMPRTPHGTTITTNLTDQRPAIHRHIYSARAPPRP